MAAATPAAVAQAAAVAVPAAAAAAAAPAAASLSDDAFHHTKQIGLATALFVCSKII
jgi:hypothetical protein